MTDPQMVKDQARRILGRFFALQRVALGGDRLEHELERGGWSLRNHMRTVRLLGDGCHNLAEIAETGDGAALTSECRWLYEMAERGLPYPGCWDRDDLTATAWREFWEAVAAPLNAPPAYGQPWEKIESQQEALHRIRYEAESRGLSAPLPWWATLLCGWPGTLLPRDFANTYFGRRNSARPYKIAKGFKAPGADDQAHT